jgi:hypothetical protein
MEIFNKEAFDKLSSFYFETVIDEKELTIPTSMLSKIFPEMYKNLSDLLLDKIIECDKKAYEELDNPEVSPLKEYLHQARGNLNLPYINHALDLAEIVSWFYDKTLTSVGNSSKMYLPLQKMTDDSDRKNTALYSLDFYNFWRRNVDNNFTDVFISKIPVVRTISFFSLGYNSQTEEEKQVWNKLYEDLTKWYLAAP